MSEAGSGNEACVCVNETKVTTDSEKIAIEVAAIVSRSNEQRCALADWGHNHVFAIKCPRGGSRNSCTGSKMNMRVQSHWPTYWQQGPPMRRLKLRLLKSSTSFTLWLARMTSYGRLRRPRLPILVPICLSFVAL
jgi:hypothetical protein